MKKYIPREIEESILSRSREFPVIVLTGPRQTGKSTLLKHLFSEYKYVTLDDPLTRSIAKEDPTLFLQNNKAPLIIDEIQYAPEILSYLKIEVDKNRDKSGQYILTGSQIFPLMQGVSESLAGRAALFELLGISMKELSLRKKCPLDFCYNAIFKGFYPDICIHSVDSSAFYSSYVQAYLERDIRQVRAVHDLTVFQNFLEILAARAGSLLNIMDVSKECGVSSTTIKNWLGVLEQSRMIYLLRPYSRNISKRVIKSPKIYFTDTGLLAYLLRYPNAEILQRGPASGAIFENFIVMEFLKYKWNYNLRFELFFYRDSNKNEIDLVLDLGYKRVGVEIKKTMTPGKEHAKVLLKHADSIGLEDRCLLSGADKDVVLNGDIKLLPWWKFDQCCK